MKDVRWYEPDECEHGCGSLQETYDHIARSLDDPGWFVMAVLGDARHAPWSYTIGLLENFAHPEFVVFGLPTTSAHGLLNHLGFCVRRGERFETDPARSMEMHGHPVRLSPVHQSHWKGELLNQWIGYYESVGLMPGEQRAIQALWAGEDGRFPGDPGAQHLRRRQPLLSRPPVSAN